MDNIIDYEIGLSVKDGYPFSIEYTKKKLTIWLGKVVILPLEQLGPPL